MALPAQPQRKMSLSDIEKTAERLRSRLAWMDKTEAIPLTVRYETRESAVARAAQAIQALHLTLKQFMEEYGH